VVPAGLFDVVTAFAGIITQENAIPILTDVYIEEQLQNGDGSRREFSEDELPGLRLRTGDGGAIWSLLTRTGQNQRCRVTLGGWPELDRAKAIEFAKQTQARLHGTRNGGFDTLADLVAYYERFKAPQLRQARATMGSLKSFLDPLMLSVPERITRRQIAELAQETALLTPIHANRKLAYAKAFFSWCRAQGLIDHHPAERIPKPVKERARETTPSVDDVARIWIASAARPGCYRHILRLLILTACRRDEVGNMRVEELALPEGSDTGVWTIPPSRSKNGRAIKVPLSPAARAVVQAALSEAGCDTYVFVSIGGTPFCSWSKAKDYLDRHMLESELQIPRWRHHDLRRAFVTAAVDELGIPQNVTDRCLNHTGAGAQSTVARVYDRSELFAPRKAALEAWAELVADRVAHLEPGFEDAPRRGQPTGVCS
jgi:integrase